MTKLFSFNEIRDYCEGIKMTECHVYYCDPYDEQDPFAEDPHGQVFSVDALIDFLKNDNLYEQGRETLCHGLVMFDEKGYVGEVLTA